MKFLSVREFRNHPGRIWSRLKREDLIVTSNGKPVGILIGLAEGKMDEALSAVRRARAAIAVSRLRRRAAETGIATLSARQIENEIRAARRGRSRS
jgi:antitoxin (DNA-binding transcriptional repressor) of toxin-antitoxin stability system